MLVQIGQIFVETETGETSLELSDLFLSGPVRDQMHMLQAIAVDVEEACLDAVDAAFDEVDSRLEVFEADGIEALAV